MDKITALNILTKLANVATVKGGVFKDISEAGAVFNALMVLSTDIKKPEEGSQE